MDFAQNVDQTRFDTTADYEHYLERLRAFPAYARENVDLLREGIRTGWTLPRAVLAGYEKTIEAHVVSAPAQSLFFRPFRSFPAAVPGPDRARLTAAAEKVVREDIVPAYRSFLEFMPRCQKMNAACSLKAAIPHRIFPPYIQVGDLHLRVSSASGQASCTSSLRCRRIGRANSPDFSIYASTRESV